MSDPTEVARLRARVAELEEQLSATPAGAAGASAGSGGVAARTSRSSPWWAVGSAVALVLACVLSTLSVAAVWTNRTLSDTEQYVDTVAPLAQDPAVQAALATRITATVMQEVDVQGLTTEALTTLANQPDVPPRVSAALPALAPPIANGVESFTRTQVENILATPQFAQLWREVNRIAHQQVVKLLEGNQGGALSAQGDSITLNLAPIIAAVKTRLVDQGFSLASRIPTVDRSFVLVRSDAITQAQSSYRLLNTLGFWLPILTIALFVGGVLLARDRRRALVKGALGVTAAMLVLGVVLALTRSWYVDNTPGNLLSGQAAGSVFDTLVRFLRTSLRAVAVLGLVLAIGAYLVGPDPSAVRVRSALRRGVGALRGSAEAAGWNTGPFGSWVFVHERLLQVAVACLGGLVLIFWPQPTGWVVVGTAAVVVLAIGIVDFLGRPPAEPATVPAAPAGSGGSTATSQSQSPVSAHSAEIPQQRETSDAPSPEGASPDSASPRG
jgi:hypothetical protein